MPASSTPADTKTPALCREVAFLALSCRGILDAAIQAGDVDECADLIVGARCMVSQMGWLADIATKRAESAPLRGDAEGWLLPTPCRLSSDESGDAQ